MADQQERTTGNGDQQARFIEERKQQIRKMTDSLSLLARLEEIEAEAADVERSVQEKVKDKEEGKKVDLSELPRDGEVGDKVSLRHKFVDTNLSTKEILKKIKERPDLIPASAGSTGGDVIKKILSKIDNPDVELSPASASYVVKLINKAARGGISNPLQALTPDELKYLQAADPIVGKKIVDSLTESAGAMGVSQPDIDRFKQETEKPTAEDARKQIERVFGRRTGEYFADLGIEYLEQFYDESDEKYLRGLSSIKEFEILAEDERKAVIKENPSITNDNEIDRLTSERIEREITVRYSKLFQKADTEAPDEFFEQILQSGSFLNSIQIVKDQLLRKIDMLVEAAEREEREGTLPDILKRLSKKRVEPEEQPLQEKEMDTGETDVNRKPITKRIYRMKIMPLPPSKQVKLGDYLLGLKTKLGDEFSARSYLHNVRAIFLRGKGEKGFWDQLKQYSSRLGSRDIDGFMELPDSELFMSAYRLYTKYVEEEFAKFDWIHEPSMFSRDPWELSSPIERRVLADLKKLFPEEAKDQWRLRRAMTMGIGLSKGVFLSEVEAAAWADPDMIEDDKGRSTFRSYYTNDNAALSTLNPLHHFLRWQQEGVMRGPLFFQLVSGFEHKRIWDHTKLWERMRQYQDSFIKGESAYGKRGPNERTLLDIMPNIANVGSFITRSGWRLAAAMDGWMEYAPSEDRGLVGNKLLILDSWKAIENIGYEALLNFCADKDKILVDFFLKGGVEAEAERDKFFRYLNDNYINFDNRTGRASISLEEEIRLTRPDVVKTINQLIGKGKIPRGERDNKITEELYRRLMNKALVGVLRNRLPTKFLRLERNRTSATGRRAWEKVRSDLNDLYRNPKDPNTEWGATKMDKAMDNLMLVELKVRQETTDEMWKFLREHGEKSSLKDFQTNRYVVTEDAVKEKLAGMKVPQDQITDALRLFNKINSDYLQNRDFINNFAYKIRDRDAAGNSKEKAFPFAIAEEELETPFLTLRAAGESVMARAMGDTAGMEQRFTDNIQGYLNQLHQTSINPNHDISELIKILAEAKQVVEEVNGPKTAFKLMHDLGGMTIAYFKKDSIAKNFLGRLTRKGRRNSLAAEFAGTYRGVWEWETKDIDHFITEMERQRLIPKEPFELNKPPELEPREIKIPGFNKKIRLGFRKIKYDPEIEFYGKRMRKDFGATKLAIAWELIQKYLPITVAIILILQLSKAFKEEVSENK